MMQLSHDQITFHVVQPHELSSIKHAVQAAFVWEAQTLEAVFAEQEIAQRSPLAGLCVGIFDEYGPAQRLYAKRGFVPDGRGVCKRHTPLRHGEQVRIEHDLLLWLIKDVAH